MSARLLRVLAGAFVLSSVVQAAGHAAPTARLTGVTTKTEGVGTTVVIEATEPVSYVAAQPDPLTLLVDLRNVAPGDVRPGRPSGALAYVAVESTANADGSEFARVRMLLARPGMPVVRGSRNAVIVEFNGADAAPAVQRDASVEKDGSVAAAKPSQGSALTKVETSTGPEGTRVTFSGPGAWRPGTIETAKDLPPRLVVDFPDLLSTLPAVTPVGKGPVDRIRVAINRREPLVTRAVIDLKYPAAHRVEPTESGVAILFTDPVPEPRSARTASPPQPAPAELPAAASRARTPETASEPRPESTLEPKPAPKPEPMVEAAAAPKSAASPVARPGVKADPAPVASEARPAEPKTVIAAEPRPLVAADPKPARQPAPAPEAKPQEQKLGAEGNKQYTGHLVTFDFFQADLRSVLRTFSEISGLNVVIDPSITPATVDVSLKEVPWDHALEVILRSHQLGYVLENNVVRIAPLKLLAQEETERQKLVEAQAMNVPVKVLTKTLSYARAEDLAKLLRDTRVLSNRGTAIVDARTNTLILNDLPEALAQCDELITNLDRSEPQVEVEARIVQTSRTAAHAIGVQWGVSGRMASALANTAPVTFPAQSSVSGRTAGTQGDSAGGANSFLPSAVNLPATSATSALGISMGTLTGSFNLDVALSAMEQKGQGKILSQPKVMMQNNFEAEMTQGVQIPIQTAANNTVTVTFKDATLTLRVKPQITAANTVMMRISLENASPDYSRSVNGIPPIDTQRAITQVLINDAETMVIGGIMKSDETSARDGVPGISRIPLLRWLFRRDTMSSDQRELLIFITPRIHR